MTVLISALPALVDTVAKSPQTKVYGVDLSTHLRCSGFSSAIKLFDDCSIDQNVDGLALPLRLGVNGLKNKMKEEGLFRWGR